MWVLDDDVSCELISLMICDEYGTERQDGSVGGCLSGDEFLHRWIDAGGMRSM